MTQPDYVPGAASGPVRPSSELPAPRRWKADRPAEISAITGQPNGPRFGNPGPDQGYGLKLARLFADRIMLHPGESVDDAVAGCLAVGLKRASILGRAPIAQDFEHAFTLWGFFEGAPDDLIDFRFPHFQAASHHYWDQRVIVGLVYRETFRLSVAQVRDRLLNWTKLLREDVAEVDTGPRASASEVMAAIRAITDDDI